MPAHDLPIEGLLHIPIVDNSDQRGTFREIFRTRDLPATFVQANHSRSEARVLRGLHYHRRQADLWYVARGEALVVCVDLRIRRDPPLVWTATLSDSRPAAVFIPPGVAHGFLANSAVDLIYWVTAEYDASDEYGIAWDDPALGIDWGIAHPLVSDRDSRNERLDWARITPF